MLGWLFRKKSSAPAAAPAPAANDGAAARDKSKDKPKDRNKDKTGAALAAPAPPPPSLAVDWAARLAQAAGNDDALLALLQTAALPLNFKQAAVEALHSEAALASAERNFRNRDRRVHQLAKRRLQAAVAQRQTQQQAAQLIATARRLLDEPDLPVNRSIELDRAWQALDAAATTPAQRDDFTALTAQLARLLQQRTDTERQHKRWLADAVQAARRLHTANTDAAAGTLDRAALAAVAGTARNVDQALAPVVPHTPAAPEAPEAPEATAATAATAATEAAEAAEAVEAAEAPKAPKATATPATPPTAAVLAAQADLRQALRHTDALDGHLAVLERLLASTPGDGAAAQPDDDAQAAWQALPPLPEAGMAAVLQARHARWRQAREHAGEQAREREREQSREAQRTQRRQQAAERAAMRQPVAQAAQAALAANVAQAEAALDAGQLADAQRLLGDIDTALHGADADGALQPRIVAAQARLAQLRGWQHWAGGRAREDLVLQAEALAAATLQMTAAAAPAAAATTTPAATEPAVTEAATADAAAADAAADAATTDTATADTATADATTTDTATTDAADSAATSALAADAANDANDAHGTNADADANRTAAKVEANANASANATADTAQPGAADADVARLSVRQRADVIATLRARWKEIDRSGGAGSRALWQRFDAALKTANAPVAAFAAQQRAARDANLAARLQLLQTLEALGGTQAGSKAASAKFTESTEATEATEPAAPTAVAEPVASAEPATPADPAAPTAVAASSTQPAASAQALAAALSQFQAGWRKLGPLEHTVPRAAQSALAARLDAAVQRVEAPLRALRQQARAEREALLARARALAGDGAVRDLVGEVRALQADWQQHARTVPLARGDEQALWTAFKAAIDAAFAARDAVFSARDAELETHAAEREALIARLQIDPADSTAAQRRTLADVDAAWQRCGPAPRARADALETAFRRARGALQQWLDDAAQRAWQASCDALDAKLALCHAREQGQDQQRTGAAAAPDEAGAPAAPAASADIATRWLALPPLPAPLEDTLRRRAGLDPSAAPATATAIPDPNADALLLQLEAAWDLPSPLAFEAERRNRKLLAMKAALEGRRAAAGDSLPPAQALSLLVGRAGLDAGQRSRLDAVLAARRRRGPQGEPRHGS